MIKLLSVCSISLALFLSGCSKPGLELTEAQYGEKWPLTVSSGYVECKNNAVIFHSNGNTYAVNGVAKSQGYSEINAIWKDDPEFFEMAAEIAKAENTAVDEVIKAMGSPSKISIGPILDSGLKLCK
jgi:hypothetical protein